MRARCAERRRESVAGATRFGYLFMEASSALIFTPFAVPAAGGVLLWRVMSWDLAGPGPFPSFEIGHLPETHPAEVNRLRKIQAIVLRPPVE